MNSRDPEPVFVKRIEAEAMLCCGRKKFGELVKAGRIGTFQLAGSQRVLYSRQDVLNEIAAGTKPAIRPTAVTAASRELASA